MKCTFIGYFDLDFVSLYVVPKHIFRYPYSVRQHSLYSLIHGSSNELKMCLMRKKIDTRVFFYFFLRHAKKSRIFFTKICKKCPMRRKNLTFETFFFLIFFPPTWLKSLRGDSWTKEYSECRLTIPRIFHNNYFMVTCILQHMPTPALNSIYQYGWHHQWTDIKLFSLCVCYLYDVCRVWRHRWCHHHHRRRTTGLLGAPYILLL